VNICNNFYVDKVDECIVYKSAIDRAGVENSEVHVFNARGVEVGVRVSASIQSHSVDRISLLAASLDHHAISNQDVMNIFSYLGLS
jgi:hypothetical protein